MQFFDVVLNLSYERAIQLYQGAQSVHTQTTDGRSIELPAGVLFEVMEHTGLKGIYRVSVGADNRFSSIRKIGTF